MVAKAQSPADLVHITELALKLTRKVDVDIIEELLGTFLTPKMS